MKVNAEAHVQQASRNDDRSTKVGKFIRKYSLDEFPQFINVLKGEMSIVGPPPHMVRQTDQYSKLVKQYMVRQFFKPGITGLAQVNRCRGETKTVEEVKARVEHDLWSMENWSLWLDLKILFLTALIIIKGDKKAY